MIGSVRFDDIDRIPFRHAYGLMPGVLSQWHDEGLPRSIESENDIYEYFGFATRSAPLPLNVGFDPAFETLVLHEDDSCRIAIDDMGRKTKLLKEYASLPLAMEYPVTDTRTWADYKGRLHYSRDRIGRNIAAVAAQNVATGHLNQFGAMGFYWFPRDLMGDKNLCIAYIEQPDLVTDILETWCSLIETLLSDVLQAIRLDKIHFGEDMAYRNGSMIGRKTFQQFMMPYYRRIQRLVRQHDVPIFSVDTDGHTSELNTWFAECGVNIIGPNEVQANNDITTYRAELGKTMAYDGGLDKRVLLNGKDAIDAMLTRIVPYMKNTRGGWCACLDYRVLKGTPLSDFQYYVNSLSTMTAY